MIVTLDQTLFSEEWSFWEAYSFVEAARRGEHVLLTDPVWDPAENDQPVVRWLNVMDAALVARFEAALRAGLDANANISRDTLAVRIAPLTESDWGRGELTPEDGLRVLSSPLWLALENGRNDLSFLRRILPQRDRHELDKRLGDGRVEVPLGGGTGELKHFLQSLKNLPRRASSPLDTTRWVRRLRSLVLFDKDAAPGDATVPFRDSATLSALCQGMTQPRPFPGHQLGRRTIENYLPFEALRLWAAAGRGPDRKKRREKVDAFEATAFGAERRACYAMKKGLSKDAHGKEARKREARRASLTELPPPFQGLTSSQDVEALWEGFGDDIAGLFSNPEADDRWFWGVFDKDPAAKAWRASVIESLWAVY
jgi:hypothetical protein